MSLRSLKDQDQTVWCHLEIKSNYIWCAMRQFQMAHQTGTAGACVHMHVSSGDCVGFAGRLSSTHPLMWQSAGKLSSACFGPFAFHSIESRPASDVSREGGNMLLLVSSLRGACQCLCTCARMFPSCVCLYVKAQDPILRHSFSELFMFTLWSGGQCSLRQQFALARRVRRI